MVWIRNMLVLERNHQTNFCVKCLQKSGEKSHRTFEVIVMVQVAVELVYEEERNRS